MSPRDNKFNGSKNFTNYFMYENWVNYVYSFMVTDVYSPWMQIKRISQDEGTRNDEIYALAQIIKIAALHRTTDMFGPIPYSQVGKGSFKVAYDSQESVYRSFLKELEEAVQTLTITRIRAKKYCLPSTLFITAMSINGCALPIR